MTEKNGPDRNTNIYRFVISTRFKNKYWISVGDLEHKLTPLPRLKQVFLVIHAPVWNGTLQLHWLSIVSLQPWLYVPGLLVISCWAYEKTRVMKGITAIVHWSLVCFNEKIWRSVDCLKCSLPGRNWEWCKMAFQRNKFVAITSLGFLRLWGLESWQ